MLEVGLLDSKMNQFSTSLQAISAIYVAKKYLKFHNSSPKVAESLALRLSFISGSSSALPATSRRLSQIAIKGSFAIEAAPPRPHAPAPKWPRPPKAPPPRAGGA